MHKITWTASLSNGETLYEGRGDYHLEPGNLSPWQRLLRHLEETGATITSLSLSATDGRRWNVPSAGKNPRFHAFTTAPQPVKYNFFRKFGQDQTGPNAGQEDHFTCIEATYQDGRVLQLWVDEDTENAWTLLT